MKSKYDYLLDKVTDSLLRQNSISMEEAEVYRFGVEVTILKALHLLSYFTIALCMKRVPEFIIIFGIFYAFRQNVGGYHAKTRMACYLFSCTAIAISLAVAGQEMNPIFMGGLAVCELLILVLLCPVKNENRPMDEEEISYFRNRLYKLVALYIVVFAVTGLLKIHWLLWLYTIGLTLATILAVLGKMQEKI